MTRQSRAYHPRTGASTRLRHGLLFPLSRIPRIARVDCPEPVRAPKTESKSSFLGTGRSPGSYAMDPISRTLACRTRRKRQSRQWPMAWLTACCRPAGESGVSFNAITISQVQPKQERHSLKDTEQVTQPLSHTNLTGPQWLDYMHQAASDSRKQRVLARFERTFGEMKKRAHWKDIYRRELEWIYQMRNRPILTGGFMRPTLFHKLVPRMYRQPLHLSMMIRRRRMARARRLDEQRRLIEWKLDIIREREFESRLVQSGHLDRKNAIWQTNEWILPIQKRIALIQEAYTHDKRRALHIFPPHIVAQIKQARTRRIERKTEQAEKLARGEWVTKWKRVPVRKMPSAGVPKRLLRGNKNPVHPHRDILYAPVMKRVLVNPRAGAAPPHILEGMSPKERWIDQAVRGKSGGGFVGQLRREKGWKKGLREGQGLEDERSGEVEIRLKKLEGEIEAENQLRRRVAGIGSAKAGRK
ncbi:unnamed protein product [Rhizoctonia solani]|uniref:Uncharacterized protein n=1 Tax=Rhizoctonia solani TaxID=456999 RepID=A0A8H3CSF0_9AGAM|nr:unnamed protein product [Rhizoctonia solani]